MKIILFKSPTAKNIIKMRLDNNHFHTNPLRHHSPHIRTLYEGRIELKTYLSSGGWLFVPTTGSEGEDDEETARMFSPPC